MAKKTTDTSPTAPQDTVKGAAEKNESGFYCYIGPNLKGLLQAGAVFRGDRANALRLAAEAIEKYPLVKTLIVSGDALPKARLRVKAPGSALYANYMKLAGK